MRKKLIEDVSMPTDAKVDFEQALVALKNRGCARSEIEYLKEIMYNKKLYDFSGYSGITTILAVSGSSRENDICIKISDVPCSLNRNFVITDFLSKYNISPRVIRYISKDKDYLIMERARGEMAINVYTDFRKLSEFMGKSLRKFHDINWNIENMTVQEKYILTLKTNHLFSEALSHKEGLKFLAQYQHDFDYVSMKKYLSQHERDYIKNDVIIHGDFNPRNIFVKNNNLSSVVDLEDTCFGDRHYDIYFSMWTVALYTGILENEKLVKESEDIFLSSYGRDKIDECRMEICKKLACMYWQEHNDIKGLI